MKKIQITLLLIANILFLAAQSSPKREMRSGWLATVWKIDWPSATISTTGNTASINSQKNQMISLLDKMKAANVNSVFFQVRSRCDAMYNSSYEPWSTDLVAVRGLDPGYDPLQFVIEEAHKRGMEVHAWLNPYRFESVVGQWAGMDGDYRATHPDWVLDVGGAAILDPGNPDVRARISDIVGEIVTDYDVDGIVFDDYFYLQGITTQDAATAALYKPATMALGDWRRANVDQMIADVHQRIKGIKNYVQFGVSPAGIWSTKQSDADKYGVKLPSGITGGYAYDGIYCDPLAWMKAKTVDYISPQIYWPTTQQNQSYTVLSQWWSDMANLFDVQFYSSHSLSGVSGIPVPTVAVRSNVSSTITIGDEIISEAGMSNLERSIYAQSDEGISTRATNVVASDYLLQIQNNREFDRNGAPGSVFYSVKSLLSTNFPAYLANNVFQNKALRPALWSGDRNEEFVSNVRVDGSELKWDYTGNQTRFTVYAIPTSEVAKVGNYAKSDYLVDVVYGKSIEIPSAQPSSAYQYAICVLDRSGNEYAPVIIGDNNIKTASATSLLNPLNEGSIVLPDNFTWTEQADAEFYIVEISSDASFSTILYKREVSEPSLSGLDLGMLSPGTDYYWRVITRRISTKDAVSTVSKFNVGRLAILSPANGDSDIDATPLIEWAGVPGAIDYVLEIASNSNFASSSIVLTETVSSSTNYQVPVDVLQYNSSYYVRVSAVVSGENVVSDAVMFSTKTMTPPIPTFVEPLDGASLGSNILKVVWNGSQYASGYRVELNENASFTPSRNTKVKTTSAFVYETEYTDLVAGTYYLRVRATYGPTSNTDWSAVHSVIITGSSIGDEVIDGEACYIRKDGNAQYLVLQGEYLNSLANVSIYNLSGSKLVDVVSNTLLTTDKTEFLIPTDLLLTRGVYLLQVRVGTKSYSLKLIN